MYVVKLITGTSVFLWCRFYRVNHDQLDLLVKNVDFKIGNTGDAMM